MEGEAFFLIPKDLQLIIDGKPSDLSRTECKLLEELASRPRIFVANTELLTSVWGGYVNSTALPVYIRRLRLKLGDKQPYKYLLNRRDVGYSLNTDQEVYS